MFLIKLIFLPVRLLFGTAALGLKVGYGSGRLIGFSRIFAFGAGVAVGVLAASPEARERALDLYRAARGAPPEPDPVGAPVTV